MLDRGPRVYVVLRLDTDPGVEGGVSSQTVKSLRPSSREWTLEEQT